MDRVARIIRLEADADKLETDASELRWQAAEDIAAELAEGKSSRQLGAEIGQSHTDVLRKARVWSEFGNLGFHDRPPFNQAYQAAKKAKEELVQPPAPNALKSGAEGSGGRAGPSQTQETPAETVDDQGASCATSAVFDPETGATIDACGVDDSQNDSLNALADWAKLAIKPGAKMNRKQYDKAARILKAALRNLQKVEVIG